MGAVDRQMADLLKKLNSKQLFNHILVKMSSEELVQEFEPFNECDTNLMCKMNEVWL